MFWAPCGSGEGGVGGSEWGMYMHAHARACMHMHACTWMCGKHDNFMQMAASIGFLGNPGNSLWCHMHACMCMHVHMCGGHPLTTYTPIHPPPTPQGGDPRNQSKFNSTWTNRDISILFADLKSVETYPLMGWCIIWRVGGWVGGWMGGWVDGWGQVKTLKILKILT